MAPARAGGRQREQAWAGARRSSSGARVRAAGRCGRGGARHPSAPTRDVLAQAGGGDQQLAVGLAVGLSVLQANRLEALAAGGVGLVHGCAQRSKGVVGAQGRWRLPRRSPSNPSPPPRARGWIGAAHSPRMPLPLLAILPCARRGGVRQGGRSWGGEGAGALPRRPARLPGPPPTAPTHGSGDQLGIVGASAHDQALAPAGRRELGASGEGGGRHPALDAQCARGVEARRGRGGARRGGGALCVRQRLAPGVQRG